MKNVIIAIIFLSVVACSKKSDPAPAPTSVKDLIGHYTGSGSTATTTLSMDIVITKTGSIYSATGSYTVNSKIIPITQSTLTPPIHGGVDFELFFNNGGLVMIGSPSADYNTLTGSVGNCKDVPGGMGNTTIPLTRKSA